MSRPDGSAQHPIGDRQLAAILFTDVAGFSRLMEANETLTLQLVQRDLKFISGVCHKYGGDVLKNTGDGCLATFRSVDSAVRSALKIQQAISEAAARLPPEKLLHHRIGIHLGDVFLSKGDVLGNGVNIAARLLTEAEPDGICISQAVYDVVKHQLGVKAVFIGARELKNIREAVPVYRLLLGAAACEAAEQPASPSQQGRRMAAVLALIAVLGIAIGGWMIFRAKPSANSSIAMPATVPVDRAPASAPTEVLSQPSSQPFPRRTLALPGFAPELSLADIMKEPPAFAADSAATWDTFPRFNTASITDGPENGLYAMTLKNDDQRFDFVQSPWGTFDDVVIEATARITVPANSFAWWTVGLHAVDGPRRLIRLGLNDRGVLRADLSRLTGVVEGTQRPLRPNAIFMFPNRAIRRADNPNTMILAVRDHQLTLLINGQMIGQTVDVSPLGRSLLAIAVEGVSGVRAEFQRLRVWIPGQAK